MTSSSDALNPPEDLFKPSRAPRYLGIFVLISIAILMGFWYAGRLDTWIDYLFPERAEVRGTVILNGQPMTTGIVQTYLSNPSPGMMGGLAPIEKDGTFRLLTNGDPGVYCGEHKVVVSYMTNTFPPKSLIPLSYTDAKTTPFTLRVKRHQLNTMELVVEAPDLLKTEDDTKEIQSGTESDSKSQTEDSESKNSDKN